MSPPLPGVTPLSWKWSAVLQGPAFAYITILLFQVKRIWGLWDYRDLPLGDTSHYFQYGYEWFRHRRVDFAWSPLYTAFYGSFLHFSKDAYVVTNLHRVVIVLLAAALVLAVLRQMLPHPIAWLTAAWWAMLSINHNTLYEVHLFSLLPILIAWLVILRGSGPWSRGIGLAILLTATVLARNELIVAVVCWGVVCLVKERRDRRHAPDAPLARVVLAYALPAALACGMAGYFYTRSMSKTTHLLAQVELKHKLNMAQVYAFGYQQRHPEWAGEPWSGYANLCQRDFGTAMPSFTQMLRRNPRAAAEHLGWNLKLLPSGLQLLLFDVYSGSFSPDYFPIQPQPVPASVYSAAAFTLATAGLVLLLRGRRWWWEHWFRSRSAGWAAMLAVVIVACFVVPTQRPRPSYLFAQGVVLMTVVATCAFIVLATIFRPWPGVGRVASRFMPALMLILPAAVYSPYAQGGTVARPVEETYHELLPFQDSIRKAPVVLVDDSFTDAFRDYLGYGKGAFLGYSILNERTSGEPLAAFLDRKGVCFFHVSERIWAQLEVDEPGSIRGLVDGGTITGWRLIAFEDTDTRWLLFRKPPIAPPAVGAQPYRTSGPSGGLQPPPGTELFSGLRRSLAWGGSRSCRDIRWCCAGDWGPPRTSHRAIPPAGDSTSK